MTLSKYDSELLIGFPTPLITQISPTNIGFTFEIDMSYIDDFVYDGATHLINTQATMVVNGLHEMLSGVDIVKLNIVNNTPTTLLKIINPTRITASGVVSDGIVGYAP